MGSVGMGRPGPGRCTRGVWGLETGARAAHTGSVGAGDQALGAACGPLSLVISAAGPKVHQGGLGTGLVAGGQSSHGWFFSDPERSRGRIRQPALSHHSVPFCETG